MCGCSDSDPHTSPTETSVKTPSGCSEVVECSMSPVINDSGYSSVLFWSWFLSRMLKFLKVLFPI